MVVAWAAPSHYLHQCCNIVNWTLNTLRPRRNGRHFPDDIFKCIFLNENTSISINVSLKFVPAGRIDNIPALVQIMAWRRPGVKPLAEPMMVRLLTHICVTRPQWVLSMLRTNFNKLLIEIHTFPLKKMLLKTSSGTWRPFFLGLNLSIMLVYTKIYITEACISNPVTIMPFICRFIYDRLRQ